MVSYAGRHAELYDLFYADKEYDSEAAFVHYCLERFGVKGHATLLELACGTGRHAFALERFGYQVTATDYSADMLAVARDKANESRSSVSFSLQDMSNLKVEGGPFDAAICLFDSIGYVGTNERLSNVFKGVRSHLKPNGLFVFEFWHAAAMLRHYDPLRVRRWQTERGQILRISETSLDYAKQLSSVSYTIYELDNDGSYTTLSEVQTNRYFLIQEMAQWLTYHDLKPLAWFSGFKDDTQITDQTWHVVTVAQAV